MTITITRKGARIGAVLGLAMGAALAWSGAARAEGPVPVPVEAPQSESALAPMRPKFAGLQVECAVLAVQEHRVRV